MRLDEVEEVRDRAGLVIDRSDHTFTRMIGSDGSVWPMHDTGYRFARRWFRAYLADR